jgi:hypothetical protein
MVGGPVFGPRPIFKQAAVVVAAFSFVLFVVWLLVGCSTHSYLYRPVPAALVPKNPDLPTVKADELQCLADDVYVRLATRDRMQRQYAAELRALLTQKNE